ncbi:hypothetical protein GZL_08689 [Streptomyces sp. 769]|nr:hypothetical protein GZL_08689 [Streptomyces sp. 769]
MIPVPDGGVKVDEVVLVLMHGRADAPQPVENEGVVQRVPTGRIRTVV